MAVLFTMLFFGQTVTETANKPPYPTFQMMLDSAQIVVIAKVDSMWYTVDEDYFPWTNISAEILNLYIKPTVYPDHSVQSTSPSRVG